MPETKYHFINLIVGLLIPTSFVLGGCATNVEPIEDITPTQDEYQRNTFSVEPGQHQVYA